MKQLVLISGESGSGKSSSLRNIKNQDKWLYLCTEAGKNLPFKNSFKTYIIVDPLQVIEAFDHAIETDKYEGIVVDSLTYLMDAYESQYVIGSASTMKSWQDYQQFFKQLIQEKVPTFQGDVLILAHTRSDLNESTMEMNTVVPIKGALKNVGIESLTNSALVAKAA